MFGAVRKSYPDIKFTACSQINEKEDSIIYKYCCSILKYPQKCVTFGYRCSAYNHFPLKHNVRVFHLHRLQVIALPSEYIKDPFV